MIKGDYEKLKDLAKFNVCAEHKMPLEVAWYGPEKCWVLRCDEGISKIPDQNFQGLDPSEYGGVPGHYPDAITRQLSLTEEYRTGEPLPELIEDNIKKGIRRRAMQQGKQPTAMTFAGVPTTDLVTGELLSRETVQALVEYAHRYNLDPARGHVVVMYSKPYITIDGYLYHARSTGIPYTLQSRPMTTEEEKVYKIGVTDHGWLAEVIFTESGDKFNGTGIVTYDEMTARSSRDETKLRSPVVAAHPWQLAQKRAEWQALRRAFPIGETEGE